MKQVLSFLLFFMFAQITFGQINGSGTTNYIPKFLSSDSIGNSNIYQLDSKIGIGITNPTNFFDVNGYSRFRGGIELPAINGDFTFNAYYSNGWKYRTNGYAGEFYLHDSGGFVFSVANSGIADNVFSFSTALRISKTGNIGIGVSNPQEKLHIGSGGKFWMDGTGNGIIALGHGIRTAGRAELHLHSDGDVPSDIFFGKDARNDNNIKWSISSRASSEGDRFSISEGPYNTTTSWESRLTIVKGGNVGIGTTNPTQKLSIEGGNNLYATIITTTPNAEAGIMFRQSVEAMDGGIKLLGGPGQRRLGFFTDDNSAGNFSERMTIKDGNVGIGITNPGNYKLNVAGGIRADSIVITSGGADFVFEQNYTLLSLNEVEQFVKTNKHLPEIPKAEQMQKEGVSVGAMQTKLLQKVEELTLYLIEQDKRIEKLEKENKLLRSK